MNMKKKSVLIAMAAFLAVSLTGCVKVVKTGEEGQYTGEKTFDSGEESGTDWDAIAEEIKAAAVELGEAEDLSQATAVKGTAEILEYGTKGPKIYLSVKPEDYSGEEEVVIQAGGVYSGTTIRDIQTIKGFEDFTNQTEWSEYGKALNAVVDEKVVAPLGIDDTVKGKKVTFTGAAVKSNGTITITPVEMTIE